MDVINKIRKIIPNKIDPKNVKNPITGNPIPATMATKGYCTGLSVMFIIDVLFILLFIKKIG